jgi:hypothetical protein
MNRRDVLKKLPMLAAAALGSTAALLTARPVSAVETVMSDAITRGLRAAQEATEAGDDEWLFVPRGYVEMREQTFALKMVQAEREHILARDIESRLPKSITIAKSEDGRWFLVDGMAAL